MQRVTLPDGSPAQIYAWTTIDLVLYLAADIDEGPYLYSASLAAFDEGRLEDLTKVRLGASNSWEGGPFRLGDDLLYPSRSRGGVVVDPDPTSPCAQQIQEGASNCDTDPQVQPQLGILWGGATHVVGVNFGLATLAAGETMWGEPSPFPGDAMSAAVVHGVPFGDGEALLVLQPKNAGPGEVYHATDIGAGAIAFEAIGREGLPESDARKIKSVWSNGVIAAVFVARDDDGNRGAGEVYVRRLP